MDNAILTQTCKTKFWSSKSKIIKLNTNAFYISHLDNALSVILANALKEARKLILSHLFL